MLLAATAAIALAALLPFAGNDASGQTTTSSAPDGNATRGKVAFLHYGCYECHGTVGQGNGFSGPTLAPHPIPYAAVIAYIRHPAGQMPAQSAQIVPDAAVADIYAYLQSIPASKPATSIPALSSIATAPKR
jgi:ubiquinol-cytochrome c reductase cytochrome c subunit